MEGISIIIPVHNEEKLISRCLDAIVGQSCPLPFEVIVVNNGSTDKTVEVASSYAQVKVIGEFQLGRSRARNRGAREAKFDVFCFVDADVIIGPDFFEPLLRALKEPFGLVQPLIDIHYCSPLVRFFYRGALHFCARDIPWLTIDSAAMMIRRSTFFAVDGFDENLKRLEDTNLTMKVVSQGFGVAVLETSKAVKIERRNILQHLSRSYEIGRIEFLEMNKWIEVPPAKWKDYFTHEWSPTFLPRLMQHLGALRSKAPVEKSLRKPVGWKRWDDRYLVSKAVVVVATPEFVSLRTFNCQFNCIFDCTSSDFTKIYQKILTGEPFVEESLTSFQKVTLNETQKAFISQAFIRLVD